MSRPGYHWLVLVPSIFGYGILTTGQLFRLHGSPLMPSFDANGVANNVVWFDTDLSPTARTRLTEIAAGLYPPMVV